jgi:hypothetical protein
MPSRPKSTVPPLWFEYGSSTESRTSSLPAFAPFVSGSTFQRESTLRRRRSASIAV